MAIGSQGAGAAAVLVFGAGAARAECVSVQCSNQIMQDLAVLFGYVLLAVVLLVMLIRRKWRAAGLRGLALAFGVFVGLPLVSQAWLGWKTHQMEQREVLGQPPPMADRTPLVIIPSGQCRADACEAVLRSKGADGAYVVDQSDLTQLDLTRPIAMTDLPLKLMTHVVEKGGERGVHWLSAEERAEAAGRIDYLVITALPYEYFRFDPRETRPEVTLDDELRANPALSGMRTDEFVQFAMAPLDPAAGRLSLADLHFDLLELWLYGQALALPLAPDNWTWADNSRVTADRAAQSICPLVDGAADWACPAPFQ